MTSDNSDQTDRIVYFGDSLTDGGTIFELTSQILAVPFPLASEGYVGGVFSDGPVYSQVAPDLLGIGTVENFAVGGARALGSRPISEIGGGALDPLQLPGVDPELLAFDIDFGGQIGRFLAGETADPFSGSTTASILIGLNDLAAFAADTGPDPVGAGTALVENIVLTTFGAAQTLALQGDVDRIVLYTYPDASFFPFNQFLDPALQPLADLLVEGHAAGLEAGAAQLNAAGIETIIVPLSEITGEIGADLGTFGFLNAGPVLFGSATDPDVAITPDGIEFSFPENPAVAGLDADQIVFYDLLHPTAATHGIFAAFTEAVLEDATHFLTDEADIVRGTRDDDFVLAKGGNDIVRTGRGEDVAFGGLGHDWIATGRGDDIASGGSGNDVVHGGRGADVVAGNAGNDWLTGGRGNDILIDGLGSDYAFGGRGNDVFLYTDGALIGGETGADHDLFVGGRGYDTVFLAVRDEIRADVEADAATSCFGINHIDALNLTLIGIEDVVVVDDRQALASVSVSGVQEDLLAAADLWGLV
ncbi:MAG: SGNH/GDSL hydrolase family protein [Pseudomonadota bacterium]